MGTNPEDRGRAGAAPLAPGTAHATGHLPTSRSKTTTKMLGISPGPALGLTSGCPETGHSTLLETQGETAFLVIILRY